MVEGNFQFKSSEKEFLGITDMFGKKCPKKVKPLTVTKADAWTSWRCI